MLADLFSDQMLPSYCFYNSSGVTHSTVALNATSAEYHSWRRQLALHNCLLLRRRHLPRHNPLQPLLHNSSIRGSSCCLVCSPAGRMLVYAVFSGLW
jgi:hypothetical protein